MEVDQKIAESTKPVALVSKLKSDLQLTTAGVVLPTTMAEVVQLAQFMCKAERSIPAFMRNNPGECMTVIMDGISWEMNPWALARVRYVVNDIGAYPASVFAAVIHRRAPIKEKVIAPKYTGEGQALQCSFTLHHAETGEVIEYESPKIGEIKVKNSPLWTSEPKQQLFYYSIRAMARRHFPALLLGAYDTEEAQIMARDITPRDPVNALVEDGDAPAHVHQGEVITPSGDKATVMDGRIKSVEIAPRRDAEDIEPQVPLGPEDNLIEERINPPRLTDDEGNDLGPIPPHDPETGEITEQLDGGLGLDVPDANKIKVNLMKGIKACLTKKDVEAWQQENREAWTKDRDLRKAVSDKLFEIEDGVGKL